jgi:predicted metalloendopeptidase
MFYKIFLNIKKLDFRTGNCQHFPEQMFFINFGQIWCSKITNKVLESRIDTGVHSPPEFRIIGSTSNFKEFGKAFKCKPGQFNNPVKKCTVW